MRLAFRSLVAVLTIGLAAPLVAAQNYRIEKIPVADEAKGGDARSKPVQSDWTSFEIPRAPEFAQGFVAEVEPNNDSTTATPLGGSNVVALGNVVPNGDADFWSFDAVAGDRVYAAVMTSFSANASSDSQLTFLDVDGTTILEFDDDDGSLGGLSSSIAGAVVPSTGTYFLKVNHFSATNQLRPYELHLRLQSGSPTAETEPNDTPATANPLPPNGWVSGARDPAAAAEQDWYSFTANAGDTIFLSLDLDPEDDITTWNGRLGIALFGDAGNQILVVDDGGAVDTSDSEAIFMTVKTSGTYYAFVDSASAATGGPTATYHLSVSIHPPVDEGVNCTTYTSTDVPKVIGPGNTLVSSVINVPGNPRIADVDVSVTLDHVKMGDIDAHLRSPADNDNGLFTDIGASATGGQTQMDTIFDDEAGIPPLYTVLKGPEYTPELSYRLSWYDGEDAGGTWTLDLRDDVNDANGGNLTAWSLRICEAPPPPACPPGTQQVAVYGSDFEINDGGFTHSGTADEWELGLPSFVPLTTCASGVNCWVTDLDNTYDPSSNQDLLSPAIDLTGLQGPVLVNWSQRYHIESENFDHFSVDAQEVGGANPTRLFEWLGATMNDSVGSPSTTIAESAGWGQFQRRADAYAGGPMELRFHLDSDSSVNLAGAAIDDVSVTACEPVATPEISLDKTVGTVSGACAATNSITVDLGTPVTYCYTVTNTGSVTMEFHDLVDDQLGVLLDNFPLTLDPGDSFEFTVDDVLLDQTTVNNATWTASETAGGATLCRTPALAIPDGTPGGVDDVFVIGSGGTLTDLDVSLDVTHTWVGDLAFTLTNGATSVVFFDRPGVPASTFGCSGDDIAATLDDEAATPVENECGGGVPTIDGTFQPNNPLSAFDGVALAGTWTLNAEDFATPDPGVVNEWCLIASYDVPSVSDSDSATVTVLVPDIAVDPTSLSSIQPVDTVVTVPFDVQNNGTGDLDWTIEEAQPRPDGSAPLRQLGRRFVVGPAAGGAGSDAASRRFADRGVQSDLLALRSQGYAARQRTVNKPPEGSLPLGVTGTLLNQLPDQVNGIFTDVSCSLCTATGTQVVAENFAFASTETVGRINFWTGYFPGNTPTTTDVLTVIFHTDTGGIPGAAVYTESNVAYTRTQTGVVLFGVNEWRHELTLATPVQLAPGTYWLEIYNDSGAGGSPDDFFWETGSPDTVGNGQPGTVFSTTAPGTNWAASSAAAFALQLDPPASACTSPTDVPWLSVDLTAGTTPPASATTVQVSFDSTGLGSGVYDALLCVGSNDPDTPVVEVPVTLEVEDTMPFLDGFETGDTSRWTLTVP